MAVVYIWCLCHVTFTDHPLDASSVNLSGNSLIKVRKSSSPDYDNKTCVPCEANCASCQDRPDYCTSCDHHLVMHENKCYSACPEHTYETEDYK